MTGHCSNCHKVWTLETRQGVCQWCGKLATCQTTRTQALRSIKSRSNGRKRQVYPYRYDQLAGDWALYYKVTSYFTRHIRLDDRQDWLHDTMLEMAKVKAKYEAKGKPLTEAGLMRVASYEVTDYWHTLMRHRPTMLSLNSKVNGDSDGNGNGDGEAGEVMDFLADDTAIDLDLMLDTRRFLLSCPRRLVQIAYKRYSGLALDSKEWSYLKRFRKQEQKTLF